MVSNDFYRGHTLRIALGIMMLALLMAGGAGADDVASCKEIRYPGTYLLTKDILVSSGEPCIYIMSNNVVFDGNGHTITGDGLDRRIGVFVDGGREEGSIYTEITVKNLKVTNLESGIEFFCVQNGLLENNIASDNDLGIGLFSSNNIWLEGNTVSNNEHGISINEFGNNLNNMYGSNDNTLIDNTVSNNHNFGVSTFNSSNNNLQGNTVSNNGYGIYLHSSNNNNLQDNTVSNNDPGISLLGTSSDNTIYNNIFNNANNVKFWDTGYSNTWNIPETSGPNIIGGPILGGNFWGNPDGIGFSQTKNTCKDADTDEICDSGYTLASDNVDYLPLAGAVSYVKSCKNIDTPGEYVLTTDLPSSTTCIRITSSNVVLDGNGHTITGGGRADSYGIFASSGISSIPLDTITVKNLKVTNWYNGIYYLNVQNGNLLNNIASNNGDGVYLDSSNYNNLTGNTASNNKGGIYLTLSNYNNLTGNIANSNTERGGIYIWSSNYNNLTGNTASKNTDGNAFGLSRGIALASSSHYNTLTGNTASDNDYGIILSTSNNNIIKGNTISKNHRSGMSLGFTDGSNYNTIYNNIFNNAENVDYLGGYSNSWNTPLTEGINILGGPNLGGNFWANLSGTGFSQTCTDSNGDGICDSSYELYPGVEDHLPLAGRAPPEGIPVDSITGKGIVYFASDSGTIENLMAVDPGSITEPPPGEANLFYGLFRFNIIGVGVRGSATITITFPNDLPSDTKYWKYGANHTPRWYTIPASIDGNKITITLIDGGDGDDDGLVNGIIVDDGGPSVPQTIIEKIGHFGGTTFAVNVSGNYAYIGQGSDFVVLDISDKISPVEVARVEAGDIIRDIALAGNYAYVADGNNGLVIVDVTDPATPNLLGRYNTIGNSLGVVVEGNYAYVADSGNGLVIVDVTDPEAPKFAGSYNTAGNSNGVAVEGSYAYMADDYNGLVIVDVREPEAPKFAGGYNTAGYSQGVAVEGNYAYVADSGNGLVIVDVSDPTVPAFKGRYDIAGNSIGVTIEGNYAYVADAYNGLMIFYLGDPEAPKFAGSYNTGTSVRVVVEGNYAYVADLINGFVIVDVTDPEAPNFVGSYITAAYSMGVALEGNYAYVADGYNGLVIFDMSDPATPTFIGRYNTAGYSSRVVVEGIYAYVADGNNGLVIVDVSEPEAPDLKGSYDIAGDSKGVAVEGNYAYVADRIKGLVIVDVSNPEAPIHKGSYATSGESQEVAVEGNYAYLAEGPNGLEIVDVSNPEAPAYKGSYATTGESSGLVIKGNYAFVADGGNGLVIVDVRYPEAPAFIGSYDTAMDSQGVAVEGNYAYVVDYSGLVLIDVSNPEAPTFISRSYNAGFSMGVAVAGNYTYYAYLADSMNGLVVFHIDIPSRVHNINKGINYTTIQSAIDEASAGDEIQVDSGPYYENVYVNKRLTLRGIGMPVVNAGGSGDAITLDADGIVLEGFTTTANGNYQTGIKVISNNNTLGGNNASNNLFGILLSSSSNNTLRSNNASYNFQGIFLDYSSNNTLISNTANSNIYQGFEVSGGDIVKDYYNNTIDISNTVNGNPVYYFFDRNDIEFDGKNAGHLTFAYSSNISIKNSIISKGDGVSIIHTTNSTLSGNKVSNNVIGIHMSYSSNNNLSCNNASNNDYGIYMDRSSNNNMLGDNNVSNNNDGIYMSYSSNNTLSSNNANSNNNDGIYMSYSSNNTLSGNNANLNQWRGIQLGSSSKNNLSGNNVLKNWNGIFLYSSSNNTIYNNIFNNTNNALFSGSNVNSWNTTLQSGINIIGGSFLGGNFWAHPNGTGFSIECSVGNDYGICNDPYALASSNIDYLPLAAKQITDRVHNINTGKNYTTIQAAIYDSSGGDEIHVDSGTYYENVDVNKNLILRGIDIGSGMPVVDARGIGSPITLSGGLIILEGFTATGAGSSNAGINITSFGNTLNGNFESNNDYGIYLDSSSSTNIITHNTADSNKLYGIFLNNSGNNKIIGNTANSNNEIGIFLKNSGDNRITGNTALNNGFSGIYLGYSSSYNIISVNTASNNGYAILLRDSSNNIINGNNASNNREGISLDHSSNNEIKGNTANLNNKIGISLGYSSNNNIKGNTANSNSEIGISLVYSSNNNITDNTALINNYGILLDYSSSNLIYNNQFNNTHNALDYENNIWNITKIPGTNIIGGSFIGGNFWVNPDGSGFSKTCPDDNLDGICDSSYDLESNIIDYLPIAYNSSNPAPTNGPVHNINNLKDYTTIQAAIDDAIPGDEIHVRSGIYYENVNVNKQLTLHGIGMPVVDASGSESAITFAADGIRLEGFSATEAGPFPDAGIKIFSNNNMLSDNNASKNDHGIYLVSSSNNNVLSGNNATNNNYGIHLFSSNNKLIGNNALNNSQGIMIRESSNNTLSDNNVSNNQYGIYLYLSSYNKLSNNNASNNSASIHLYLSSYNKLSNNNASNSKGGISLSNSSNNTLSGNNASSNDYGISLYFSSNYNTLRGNNVLNNSVGIHLLSSSSNKIHNNLFNNTNNVQLEGSNINTWNTTLQSSPNIIGGPNLGGNFWAHPNGTGFSLDCGDDNGDGICNDTYTLDSSNIDYLPLANPGAPDFTISVSPLSQSVAQGNSTTYNISLTSLNGFNSTVSLSASSLPPNASTSFNPGSVTPTGTSTLTIQTSGSTPSGSFNINITGTGGGKTHNITAELIVSSQISHTISLLKGWNMISLPVNVSNASIGALFGSNVTTVYGWTGTSYALSSALLPRRGYWALSSSNYDVTVTGTPVVDRNITLTGGWNMIGPVTNGIMVSSLPNITTVYGWTGTSYIIVSGSNTLTLTKGYWILANATSTINV